MAQIIEGAAAPVSESTVQKCLACGYTNQGAEELCAACGSSLRLKLCAGCEAINGSGAERCHACGAGFASPGAGRGLTTLPPRPDAPPAARRNRQLATLIALPLFATLGLAYYVYGQSLFASNDAKRAAAANPRLAPTAALATDVPVPVVAKPKEAAPAPTAAPSAVVRPKEAPEAKAADAITVRANRASPPVPAVTPLETTAAPERSRHPWVTHTKRATKDEIRIPAPVVRANNSARVQPVSGAEASSPACSEVTAALGFCISKGGR